METLRDKIVRLSKMANPVEKRFIMTKTTAAPATPQDNIIAMRQEIYRLREGLNEAILIIESLE